MVANESEYPDYDKKDEKGEYFTVVVISRVCKEKERQKERYLKAERGGGGGAGVERPQAMFAIGGP